jgi:hypothetical protein
LWLFTNRAYTNTVAKILIPLITRRTALLDADAFTALFAPPIARRAHLGPFAHAFALLPVPVLVARTDRTHVAFAFAPYRVPNLELRAEHKLRAHAFAEVKIEVLGINALHSLIAVTEAGCWIQIKWCFAKYWRPAMGFFR